MTPHDTKEASRQRSTTATALNVGKTLSFITTDECSARCAHCLMQSGPPPMRLRCDSPVCTAWSGPRSRVSYHTAIA